MTDLIRREDALEVCTDYGFTRANECRDAIAALPAVTVGVQEAVIHRAVLDWVKDDTGAAIKMTITPDQANALTARILAALEPVAATDSNLQKVQIDQPVRYCPICDIADCATHREPVAAPVFGRATFCDTNSPAPDPAAIREAAAVVEREIEQAKQLMPMVVPILRGVHRSILALIPKGATE